MKPQPEFVLGFVGHRHLADEVGLRPAIRLCLERFAAEAVRRGGRLNVYCSISYGADLLFIECAHELGLPVHLLLAKKYYPGNTILLNQWSNSVYAY